MRRRLNPWPAYVDLFGALLVATFGGLMVLSANYTDLSKSHDELQKSKGEITRLEQRIREIVEKIDQAAETLRQEGSEEGPIRRCGNGFCIDLYVHFERNRWKRIEDPDEKRAIKDICGVLKDGLDQLGPVDLPYVEVVVEGHTDSTQPYNKSKEDLFAHNWILSAQRALTILYELSKCGLEDPQYKISSVGYADSKPLCLESEPTEQCHKRNRRTTLRIHIDTTKL